MRSTSVAGLTAKAMEVNAKLSMANLTCPKLATTPDMHIKSMAKATAGENIPVLPIMLNIDKSANPTFRTIVNN